MKPDREAEFDAASLELAEAKRRFKAAEVEMLRADAPENLDRPEDINLWLRDTFRRDRERFTTLSGEQFEKFLEHGYSATIVTPFGLLQVVSAATEMSGE